MSLKSTESEFHVEFHISIINFSISCYNDLALRNTSLLRRYCTWTKDEIISKLGVFIKRWAKECGICDASKGSLCPYGYMILLIHFLQRLQPHPLLPMLQEMGEKENIRVEGWDAYFCDESPKPDWSKCTLSVGELFLQFLEYFAKFDWDSQIVQIRHSGMLSKFERGWTKQVLMCIEDPFALDRNHGCGINNLMFTFIINSFVNSYKVFSYFNDDSITRFGRSLLVKCREITGGVPYIVCGRSGHASENCLTFGDARFDKAIEKLNNDVEERKKREEEEGKRKEDKERKITEEEGRKRKEEEDRRREEEEEIQREEENERKRSE
ncbi:hypothetical protein PMAYCL1PPCAC_19621, partial [Pristionchus mayeri]